MASGIGRSRGVVAIGAGLVAGIALALAPGPGPARADDAAESSEARGGETEEPQLAIPGRVRPPGEEPRLDDLLQLPSGYGRASRSVAGAGEAEWRRRFRESQDAVLSARSSLEETKRELDSLALEGGSSQWQVAPPGAAGADGGGAASSNSPLSFRLRQELKRQREQLDEANKALRELRIEADLAGVPQGWRGDELALEEGSPELGQLID